MVPAPRFESFEALNAWLEEQCLRRQNDIVRGHSATIGERLLCDLDALMALVPVPYIAQTIGIIATGHIPTLIAQGKSDEEDENAYRPFSLRGIRSSWWTSVAKKHWAFRVIALPCGNPRQAENDRR